MSAVSDLRARTSSVTARPGTARRLVALEDDADSILEHDDIEASIDDTVPVGHLPSRRSALSRGFGPSPSR